MTSESCTTQPKFSRARPALRLEASESFNDVLEELGEEKPVIIHSEVKRRKAKLTLPSTVMQSRHFVETTAPPPIGWTG